MGGDERFLECDVLSMVVIVPYSGSNTRSISSCRRRTKKKSSPDSNGETRQTDELVEAHGTQKGGGGRAAQKPGHR
jgi:hypothetical protein